MPNAALRQPHHPSIAPELLRLRAENEELRETVRQLMDGLGADPDRDFVRRCRSVLGVTPSRARMLAVLLAGKVRDKESMLLAYAVNRRDPPEIKIVDTLVRYLRVALAPYQIQIQTEWGVGYFLTPENRARIIALLAGADA